MDFLKHYKSKFFFIKDLLQRDDPVVVEVGAHYGEDSMRFMQVFENIDLHCFEPDPRNIKIFKKFINDNRVKLYETALSNKKGTAEFYQSYQEYRKDEIPEKYNWMTLEEYNRTNLNNSGASSLKEGYGHILDQPIKVKTDRFDTWYKEKNIGQIDLAWIDVQGAEREVIEGMAEEIRNIKYIWMEYGECFYNGAMTRHETLTLMRKVGFEEVKEHSDHTLQGDVLCKNTI